MLCHYSKWLQKISYVKKQINDRVRLTAFVNLGRYIDFILIYAWSVMYDEAVFLVVTYSTTWYSVKKAKYLL